MTRALLASALAGLLLVPGGALAASFAHGLHWQRVAGHRVEAEGGVADLALDRARRRVAVLDVRGVWLGREGSPAARLSGVTAARSLAFDDAGALWIGTSSGLWRHAAGRGLEDRSPAGAAARDIARVATHGALVVLATGAGAFASLDGRHWTALDAGAGVARPVSLAIPAPERPALGDGGAARVLVAGAFGTAVVRLAWRDTDLRQTGLLRGRAAARDAEPLDAVWIPDGSVRREGDAGSGRWVAALPDDLAVAEPGREDFGWLPQRVSLPPGAALRRLRVAGGRLWIASDRGLLVAPGPAGPVRRASLPAGTAGVHALAGDAESLWALTEQGLLEGRPVPGAGPPPGGVAGASAGLPPVAELQRAVLRHTGLGLERIHRQGERVRRRGRWPTVDLRLGADQEWDRRHASDQSFVSGDTRYLSDLDRDRSLALEGSLTLRWDLADAVHDPEWIDFSRERRLLLGLRDDVLDEVHQLYFELRALRARMPGLPAAERGTVALEIARRSADLDAWTGGWFGAHSDPAVAAPPDSTAEPSLPAGAPPDPRGTPSLRPAPVLSLPAPVPPSHPAPPLAAGGVHPETS